MATCKGRKNDGTPCKSSIVLDNGYCRAHQDQAPEAKTLEESVRWTRERLEAAIAAHGGPEELPLGGADLSNLDLRMMNLDGITLTYSYKEDETIVLVRGANLQGADLQYASLQGANLEFANLQGANLVFANLQGADLSRADLQGASLFHANLQGTILQLADLREVDLLDVATGGLLGIRLYRAKLDHTRLKKEQLGPAIGDEQAGEYRQARDAYLALKQNFEGLGDYEAASWAYIKERKMEKACSAPWRARRFYGNEQLGDRGYRVHRVDRDTSEYEFEYKLPAYHPRVWWFFVRHFFKWLGDWLVELVCGYGERPWRTVATMVVVFAVFVVYTESALRYNSTQEEPTWTKRLSDLKATCGVAMLVVARPSITRATWLCSPGWWATNSPTKSVCRM